MTVAPRRPRGHGLADQAVAALGHANLPGKTKKFVTARRSMFKAQAD
jgi:hypothetical protein